MKVLVFDASWTDKRLVRKVITKATKLLNQPDNLEVEVSFVDKQAIKQLNNEQRQIDSVTDVLSFPTIDAQRKVIDTKQFQADVNPVTGNLMLGDIVICRDKAVEQAKEYGHSLKRELAFLTLHGLLHLLGYDHLNEQDEKQMFALQTELLDKLHIKRD